MLCIAGISVRKVPVCCPGKVCPDSVLQEALLHWEAVRLGSLCDVLLFFVTSVLALCIQERRAGLDFLAVHNRRITVTAVLLLVLELLTDSALHPQFGFFHSF